MVSQDVLDYIKEQLKAGYSQEEIKTALTMQGWSEGEIAEGFGSARPPGVYPPVKIKKGGKLPLLISLLGGLILFITGLETLLSLRLVTSALADAGLSLKLLGLLAAPLGTSLNTGTVITFIAVIVIMGSLLVSKGEKKRMGGVLVLLFSVLSLAGFNGTLLIVGSVLGIVGGLLAVKG